MATRDHPLGSVAAFKRACEPGATLRIVNHIRPQASRLATVLPKTNTVNLVTTADGAPRGSHLRWPKAADFRPDPDRPDTVHIDFDGKPGLTITVLESEHLETRGASR